MTCALMKNMYKHMYSKNPQIHTSGIGYSQMFSWTKFTYRYFQKLILDNIKTTIRRPVPL